MFEEVRLPEYHVLINPSVKSYYFTYLVLFFWHDEGRQSYRGFQNGYRRDQ
jgi:hypothetical protein